MQDSVVTNDAGRQGEGVPKSGEMTTVFLVGFPRSGTTMLAAALGRHSAIAATPETVFFRRLFFVVDRLLSSGADANQIAQACVSDMRFRDLGIGHADFVRLIETHRPANATAFFAQVLESFAMARQRPIVLEKSPAHLMYMIEIASRFPDAKFIMLLRDGRDSILSLLNVPWAHRSVGRHAAEWCYQMKHFSHCRQQLGARIYVARYEEIVASPVSALTGLAGFLGVEYEEAMRSGTEGKTTVVPEWEKAWKANASQPIGTRSRDGWRATANPRQVAVMNYIMGEELRALGYGDIEVTNISLFDRIVADALYRSWFYPVYRQIWLYGSRLRSQTRSMLKGAK